jgi:hypothetical protein
MNNSFATIKHTLSPYRMQVGMPSQFYALPTSMFFLSYKSIESLDTSFFPLYLHFYLECLFFVASTVELLTCICSKVHPCNCIVSLRNKNMRILCAHIFRKNVDLPSIVFLSRETG